jgi:hypothetical protein
LIYDALSVFFLAVQYDGYGLAIVIEQKQKRIGSFRWTYKNAHVALILFVEFDNVVILVEIDIIY